MTVAWPPHVPLLRLVRVLRLRARVRLRAAPVARFRDRVPTPPAGRATGEVVQGAVRPALVTTRSHPAKACPAPAGPVLVLVARAVDPAAVALVPGTAAHRARVTTPSLPARACPAAQAAGVRVAQLSVESVPIVVSVRPVRIVPVGRVRQGRIVLVGPAPVDRARTPA
jgi:hypothetical protein